MTILCTFLAFVCFVLASIPKTAGYANFLAIGIAILTFNLLIGLGAFV